jgi:hypothetical protein
MSTNMLNKKPPVSGGEVRPALRPGLKAKRGERILSE